ncbi:hypothetical protein ACFV7O_11480 [Streptomyces tendae]|uniref:hypothetical protein n=1 Tax=Streptomyces tendae TaxID=1932 RepID=UPI00364BCD86
MTWLDEVCTAAGCVFVPLDVLLEPYDGPTRTLVDEDRILVETLAALGHDGEDDEDGEDEDGQDEDGQDEDGQDEDGEDRDMRAVWADRYFDYV